MKMKKDIISVSYYFSEGTIAGIIIGIILH